MTDLDNYEIAKGNHTFAACLQAKAAKKWVPQNLKCKVYERSDKYGVLEIALTARKISKDYPLSYIEKIGALRKTLEKNNISRELATTGKISELKNLFHYLFPTDEFPRSCTLLLALPDDFFGQCIEVSNKFGSGKICYSTKKPPEFCPLPYKLNNVRVLNPDAFWLSFGKSYRQNSGYAMQVINKLSLAFGIEEAILEFKSTTSDFAQQLQNSGVQYRDTFEAAKENFSLPPNVTPSQAHFLLSNRSYNSKTTYKKTKF
uniref:Uncharacterized protein n=1 Tax=Panagrolaimus davidi TaxID=227884 RepID=A0A914PAC2_9BILA